MSAFLNFRTYEHLDPELCYASKEAMERIGQARQSRRRRCSHCRELFHKLIQCLQCGRWFCTECAGWEWCLTCDKAECPMQGRKFDRR
jgi:formylmethanofuran dehydrogenase subunit E